jgi:LysR family hydrogen peroxide-inducible transcriptional activator
MLSLRQLRYFDALARYRHFGKAAKACAVSQPALSMQIRELEEVLGAELVERRQGAITLTEVGAEVVIRARSILSATGDLVDFARHNATVLTGTLQLGMIPTLAPYLLPRMLPLLRREYPQLRLELRETQTKSLLAELSYGTLDAVMLALPIPNSEFETFPVFEDKFLLAVPRRDPLPETCRATTRDVSTRTLLLLEEGHCLRDQALSFCAFPESEAAAGLGATSLSTLIEMVASGHGVTLIPEIATDAEVGDRRLKLLRFTEPQPMRTIGIACRRTSARKADFMTLREIAIAALNFDGSFTAAQEDAYQEIGTGHTQLTRDLRASRHRGETLIIAAARPHEVR